MNQYYVVGDLNCPICTKWVSFDIFIGDYLPADAHEFKCVQAKCSDGHETTLEVTANIFGATAKFAGSDRPVQVAVKPRNVLPFMGTSLQNIIFEESQNGLRGLIEDLAHKPEPMLHRMYLMQCVANFEVFVSDTIQGLAVRNPEVRMAVINNVKDLKDKRLTLLEFSANPQIATNLLLDNLSKASFQNVEALVRYLEPALANDVLPTGGDRRFLDQMFGVRHDCVHRNGRTKSGEAIQDPLPNLERLISLFHDISLRIQQRVSYLDWEAAKTRVFAMLSRYRELIGALPRMPDGTALADVVPLEPPVLAELELRLDIPAETERNQELIDLWQQVVEFDQCTASNLRGIVEVGSSVPDNWLYALALARDISTEMLRAVASGINRNN